ncbi:MAG: hydantoinase/oxoprolinase [Rhodospirillaceae bacterium]|nr:hydantoinase/oxoprolinase [Rhodospirillaceae bacterium]|tara:strand:+ start:5118 stop:6950 length:1833 start_codon:yes stop_codon:yes gene_type:complete
MDPITFSIIRHRLFRIVDEAVITLKHVSGSAITNEGHDLMVSLYRADGSLLMGGVGFLHHLTSAAEACKSIIRNFSGNINEGDIFLLNCPYTAALHTSDIYLIAPIHHNGVLVAWSACFVHVYDIGAMNPGGFSPDSNDIFTEGFSSPGLKLVDKGEIRKDIMNTILNMVRSPEMVALDMSSMIACNNVAKDRMQSLIDKYTPKVVDKACSLLISQSEKLFKERLAELPDGCWHSRQYFDVKGQTFKVLLKMSKEGEKIVFDFSGSSAQSQYGINCSRWASWGGLFAPLFPLLCYDITWNEGVIRPVKMIAPEGSVVNATRPAPVSIATVGAIQAVNNAACVCISKMLSASDKYSKEATAVWHGSHFAIFMFGKNQRGTQSIGILTETFGGAAGARAIGDGVDVGGEVPNPISRMANVETMEATFPIRYLFRRRLKDSGGPGLHRGGTGAEFAITPHDAPDGGINYVISGKGTEYPMSDGLGGGYPGAPSNYLWVKTNEALESGVPLVAYPNSIEQIPGKKEKISWGVFPLVGLDSLYVGWNGGGGYGDPLSRDCDSVARDVKNGVVSNVIAEKVYGVVVDNGKVIHKETNFLRKKLKRERLEMGKINDI